LLKKFVPIYQKEGTHEFFSIVRIKEQHIFEPWRCAEFCQDKNLVQSFVDVFSAAKKEMRLFSMAASQFLCHYTWSDELQNGNDPWLHKAYVPKSEAELDGDEKAIETIRTLSGPVKLGGVHVSLPPEVDRKNKFERFMTRAIAAYSSGDDTNG